MCCCCGGGNIDNCMTIYGNLIYILEKLASYCALTSVLVCIVATLAMTIGVGIGIGYNYCIVNTRSRPGVLQNPVFATTSTPTLLSTNKILLRDDTAKEDLTGELYKRSVSRTGVPASAHKTPAPGVEDGRNVMTFPLHGNIDLVSLVETLRERNSSVTLKLIA